MDSQHGRDTELWTHYDVMHNLLIQISGTKKVTLWPPCEDANLYTEGAAARSDACARLAKAAPRGTGGRRRIPSPLPSSAPIPTCALP